jgi:hypothetical protein
VSVCHYLSVAPPDAEPPAPGRFASLLDELLDNGLAAWPVYVMSGVAGPHPGAFALGTCVLGGRGSSGPPPERMTDEYADFAVRYAGRDRGAIRSAVRGAPFGSEDICVYFDVKSPGADPDDPGKACHGAMFSTLEPRRLGRVGSFVLSAGGELFGFDLGDPHDPFVNGTWQPAFTYPLAKDPGYVFQDARWFVSVEGGFAWELAGPVFRVCARHRHFGAQHFAGYYAV